MFGFKGHNEPIQEEWGIFIFQPRLWHFRMLIQRCPDQLNGFEGFFWAFLLLSYLANSQGCSTTTVWPSPLIVFSGWGGWQNLMLMWAMWAVYVLVMEGSCQARTWNFGDPVATLEVKIPQLAQAPSLHPSFAPSSAWTRSAWKARHTFFSCSFVFFSAFSVFSVLVFSGKFHVGTCVFRRGPRDWHFHLGGSAMQYDQKSKSLYVTWPVFLAKKRRSFFNNETKWRQRKSEKQGCFLFCLEKPLVCVFCCCFLCFFVGVFFGNQTLTVQSVQFLFFGAKLSQRKAERGFSWTFVHFWRSWAPLLAASQGELPSH